MKHCPQCQRNWNVPDDGKQKCPYCDCRLYDGESSLPDSGTGHLCPKCGKQMSEQKKWPGLWTCPDFNSPINDKPPYRFKCTGMEIEDRAAAAFEAACWEIIQKSN